MKLPLKEAVEGGQRVDEKRKGGGSSYGKTSILVGKGETPAEFHLKTGGWGRAAATTRPSGRTRRGRCDFVKNFSGILARREKRETGIPGEVSKHWREKNI